jgi:hypothetical protein
MDVEGSSSVAGSRASVLESVEEAVLAAFEGFVPSGTYVTIEVPGVPVEVRARMLSSFSVFKN